MLSFWGNTEDYVGMSVIIVCVFCICVIYILKKEEKEEDKIKQFNSNIMNEPLLTNCPACGAEVSRNAPVCIKCGQPICSEHSASQTVVVQTSESNGAGTAGFVLALISLIFSWVPGVGWFIWFLGFLLSMIGMFKSPRTLAVFGFFISIIDFIILFALLGTVAGALSSIFG